MAAISTSAYFSSQPQLPASSKAALSNPNPNSSWPRKGAGAVMLEAYADEAASAAAAGNGGGGGVERKRSLTEEDLEELKGCLDLGFGFAYEEIPELCSTLPALELCYSMTQRFLDEQKSSEVGERGAEAVEGSSPPVPNWRISGPGDDPEEVKARLKYWAQAVACTVKLCS